MGNNMRNIPHKRRESVKMGYREYKNEGYESVKKQHNIMVLVGNGFDMEILDSFQKQTKTSYANFYHYLEYQNCREDNVIYRKMKEEKEKDNKLWGDFEIALISLLNENVSAVDLENDLHEIQGYFSSFLDDIISPEFLAEIGKKSEEKKWAVNSLSSFLQDISKKDYKTLRFPADTEYYDLFNFLIFNFNYTALLDNYIYMDKEQFDPHPYKTVDRNFRFYPNPNGYDGVNPEIKEKTWVSYLMMNVIHPHGVQSVPRSILFGFNDKDQISNKECEEYANHFIKPYWGQNEVKYKSYFAETELFILFGLSMGRTDKWWWENIVQSLRKENSELIIYMYQEAGAKVSEKSVKDTFLKEAGVELEKKEEKAVLSRIFVVLYQTDSKRVFLNSKN